jgi:hypothetical protein
MGENAVKRLQQALLNFTLQTTDRERDKDGNAAPRLGCWNVSLQFVVAQLNAKMSVQRKASPYEQYRGRKNKSSFNTHDFLGADPVLTAKAHDEMVTLFHDVCFWLLTSFLAFVSTTVFHNDHAHLAKRATYSSNTPEAKRQNPTCELHHW